MVSKGKQTQRAVIRIAAGLLNILHAPNMTIIHVAITI